MCAVKARLFCSILVCVSLCRNTAPIIGNIYRLGCINILIDLTALGATVAVLCTFLGTGGSRSAKQLKSAGITGLGSELEGN